jgi:DNA-binding transcriptional MerR regulator
MDYSIDSVVQLTGLSAFTLRNWEKRYDFLRPRRMENGFRAYDFAHVEMLGKVASLLKHGAKIGDLAEGIRKGRPLPEVITPELAPEVQAQATLLYSALVAYDVERAEGIHAELAARFSTTQMLDLIYAPLFSRLGKDWSTGKTTTAQEHFASAFIRLRLAPYLTLFNASSMGAKHKVVCATTPGELHEGGLMLITAHLRLKGWSTYYLGASLPLDDLKSAALAIRPNLICLSFSEPHALGNAIPPLAALKTRVCIGGFGALTYDGEDNLPEHIRLFKLSGKEAAGMIDTYEKSGVT